MLTSVSTESLRDVARTAVRTEVVRIAWDLFAHQGFEATTIEEIAERAGMSRRTFFRYFSGKDELIVEKLVEAGERVAAALEARPEEESAWTALREAFQVVVVGQEQNPGPARALRLMLRDEPGVRSSIEEWRRAWTHLLAPVLARRLSPDGPSSGSDIRAEAIAGAGLACLDAAQLAWTETPSTSLGKLLDQAMSAVCPTTDRSAAAKNDRPGCPS